MTKRYAPWFRLLVVGAGLRLTGAAFLVAALWARFFRSRQRGLSAVTHVVFLALVVLNLVGGFHALGTPMAVGIMILPAAASQSERIRSP